MPSPARRCLLAVLVVCVALGAVGSGQTGGPARSGAAGDSLVATGSTRAPADGVAPASATRVTDAAPGNRLRARPLGELLAVIAIVAVWSCATQRRAAELLDRRVLSRVRSHPAVGRAPPVPG